MALAEGGLEAYHLVSLDSQMAESVCLGKIKCLRPYYISEFDNPSVILRITLRNLTHSAVYFEAGEGRMGQEVMLRPHDNTRYVNVHLAFLSFAPECPGALRAFCST